MDTEISKMVKAYEDGRLTRRQLVTHLAALFAMLGASNPVDSEVEEKQGTFQATGLNHIALAVTSVERSRDFYEKHLGLEVVREAIPSNCFLSCGNQFVALFRSAQPGMDHYCYSIEDYDQRAAAEKLRAEKLEPSLAGNRIYFRDPDGLRVQLSARSHSP